MNSIIKHMIDDLHEENRELLATVERLKAVLREAQPATRIGTIGLDSATIWMGDPCYIYPTDSYSRTRAEAPTDW